MLPLSNPHPQAARTGRVRRPDRGPCPAAAGGDRVGISQRHAAGLSSDGAKSCVATAGLTRNLASRGPM